MLLLTGATGTIGMPLLRRLTASGAAVRCLVRDPRRLGPLGARVEIALGDLADPCSFAPALRSVDTVVHLASVIRDQPGGTIEELAGVATERLVLAAERARVERFVFASVLDASSRSGPRLMRAKALAERALIESSLSHTVFALGWAYAPGDQFLTLLQRMSWLPVLPIPGSGHALFQPIWAEDVAACVLAALPGGAKADETHGARYELTGPETLCYRQIVELALGSLHRRRPLLPIPIPIVRRSLRLLELLPGPAAFATWDEVELLELTLTTARGTADAERLGVSPRPMRAVLGVG